MFLMGQEDDKTVLASFYGYKMQETIDLQRRKIYFSYTFKGFSLTDWSYCFEPVVRKHTQQATHCRAKPLSLCPGCEREIPIEGTPSMS
jgi:hypothetical protein